MTAWWHQQGTHISSCHVKTLKNITLLHIHMKPKSNNEHMSCKWCSHWNSYTLYQRNCFRLESVCVVPRCLRVWYLFSSMSVHHCGGGAVKIFNIFSSFCQCTRHEIAHNIHSLLKFSIVEIQRKPSPPDDLNEERRVMWKVWWNHGETVGPVCWLSHKEK